MDYGRVPGKYLKDHGLLPESEYAKQSNECHSRKMTAEDFALMNAGVEAKAKRSALTVSITAEMNLAGKVEKPPEHMYEAMPHRAKADWLQYNPVKFDERVAG